jgi:hypothetical protein
VKGDPENFQGINVRSESAEFIGQGADAKKASRVLMVDGVLYMFIRNVDNSRWTDLDREY